MAKWDPDQFQPYRFHASNPDNDLEQILGQPMPHHDLPRPIV